MSGVIALLLIPQAVWWLPTKFDARHARIKAESFVRDAGWLVTDPKTGKTAPPTIEDVRYDRPIFNDPRRHLSVRLSRGSGYVSFDARTGRIASCFYTEPSLMTPSAPLVSREASERFAEAIIRKYGWAGKMKPTDGRRFGEPRKGHWRFTYRPEALGLPYHQEEDIRIEIDPRNGRVSRFICFTVNPPEAFKNALFVKRVRRSFYEQVSRTYGQSELAINSQGSWTIQPPPHPDSEYGNLYRRENVAAQGIVTFTLGAAWPSSTLPEYMDNVQVRYDAQRGQLCHEQHTTAETIRGLGVPPAAFPAPKMDWLEAPEPVEVYEGDAKRSAHGVIKPVKTWISPFARPVTLEFRTRVMFGRYDVKRNILQVGNRTGIPSENIAEALLAVVSASTRTQLGVKER